MREIDDIQPYEEVQCSTVEARTGPLRDQEERIAFPIKVYQLQPGTEQYERAQNTFLKRAKEYELKYYWL